MSVGARNGRIDLIRGVSIVLVLLHHFSIAYRLDDTLPSRVLGREVVHAVVRNGNYAVTMFFVVSGFLITANAQARWGELRGIDARAFYRLRVARIAPCLLLLLVVVNALAGLGVGIFADHPEGGPPVPLWLVDVASLTLWMNVLLATPAGWVNYALGVLWSLSVEEVFYLSFPLACLVLRRPVLLAAFWAVFVVAGPVWRAFHQDDEAQFLYAYLASFDGVAIGCCTALLARRWTPGGRWAGVAGPVVAVAMAVLYLAASIADTNVWGVTLMALGTAFLLLLAGRRAPGVAAPRRRVAPALEWCGRLSYELYLFHLVVLGLVRTAFPPPQVAGDATLVLLGVFLALSALLAAVVAATFSGPLNRALRPSTGSARTAAAA
ncbi:MAG: acyltransferase family protein [Janthinobacterium lividum]